MLFLPNGRMMAPLLWMMDGADKHGHDTLGVVRIDEEILVPAHCTTHMHYPVLVSHINAGLAGV